MAAPEQQLLVPNPAHPQEMEIYSHIPEIDQQAWLSFVHSSLERERLGISPAYTFDQFVRGVAPHIEGLLPHLDDLIRKGIGGIALIANYDEEAEITIGGSRHSVEPVLGAFDARKGMLERERAKGPLALLVPHASLASPYIAARSVVHTLGPEIAKKIFVVIGPRPTVMQYEIHDAKQDKIVQINPVLLGRAITNLLLTGPDTDSARNNESIQSWLKNLRRDFWAQLDEIMEPQPDGDNNIVIFCPAGRVSENDKEFRVDGSFEYLTKYPKLQVIPVGEYDHLLQDPKHPESIIFINPDASAWKPTNDKHANYLHERATLLSQSPIGGLVFEGQFQHNARLTRQKLRRKTKGTAPPYLSE